MQVPNMDAQYENALTFISKRMKGYTNMDARCKHIYTNAIKDANALPTLPNLNYNQEAKFFLESRV